MNNALISRSALLEALNKLYMAALRKTGVSVETIYHLDHLAMLVKDAHAVDAEPVRHAYWIQSKSVPAYHSCSYCHAAHKMHESCNTYVLLNYCPNCGAKMDAEVEG